MYLFADLFVLYTFLYPSIPNSIRMLLFPVFFFQVFLRIRSIVDAAYCETLRLRIYRQEIRVDKSRSTLCRFIDKSRFLRRRTYILSKILIIFFYISWNSMRLAHEQREQSLDSRQPPMTLRIRFLQDVRRRKPLRRRMGERHAGWPWSTLYQ